jgi:hypothetical protein
MKTKNKISKELENKISMYVVVLSWCMKNLPIISLIPAVLDAFQTYKLMVAEIRSLVKQKTLITTGMSEDKKKTKLLLAEHALFIADAIYAYASKNKNYTLRNEVAFCKSGLEKLRDNLFIEACNTIYDLGMANLADLTPYTIDANTMQTLQTTIDLYTAESPQPTGAIKHRSILTTAIEDKRIEIDDFKESQFDKVVKLLKPDNKSFVDEYFASSKIVDAGIRHKKIIPPVTSDKLASVSGTVKDSKGNPLKGVTCVLIAGDKNYTDVTDKKGLYVFGGVLDGSYTLQVILYGKKMIVVKDMVVKTDEIVVKDFVMENEAGSELAKILK